MASRVLEPVAITLALTGRTRLVAGDRGVRHVGRGDAQRKRRQSGGHRRSDSLLRRYARSPSEHWRVLKQVIRLPGTKAEQTARRRRVIPSSNGCQREQSDRCDESGLPSVALLILSVVSPTAVSEERTTRLRPDLRKLIHPPDRSKSLTRTASSLQVASAADDSSWLTCRSTFGYRPPTRKSRRRTSAPRTSSR